MSASQREIKVLMVLDAYFPSDIRLQKEIPELQNKAFQVTLLCYRRDDEPREDTWNGCQIIRTKKAVGKLRKTIVDIYNSLFFINPLIRSSLNNLKGNYQVIHVHDLPASNTALQFAKKRNMTAVLDMHENYPEALKIWFNWRKGFVIRLKNWLFFTYDKWFMREGQMVKSFDYTIAVVDEMKQRLVDIHQADADKITIVSNTEPKNLFQFVTIDQVNSETENIVYVGGIGPHRGLDTAIKAMPIILRVIPNAKLIIVGSGNKDNINYLKNLAAKLGVSTQVDFKGQQPFEKAIAFMNHAFLNIIPHHSNAHTDNTIPHKLFQMLNSNYPVMVSSCKPLKRIIEEFDAGIVFDAGDPNSFANKVLWANNNRSMLNELSKNGHKAVQEGRYNWETDAKVLCDLYARITK